jgi:hypothetical protein
MASPGTSPKPDPSEAARSRVQASFAIASAITTLIVAAGLFTGVADRSHTARYLGAAALAAWLVTMFLFLLAAGAAQETQKVERRAAAVSAAVATVVTITAFVLVTSTGLAVDVDNGVMELSPSGQTAVHGLCRVYRGRLVPGELEVPSLKTDYVVFKIDQGSCLTGSTATVKLPRADVVAFLEDGKLRDGTDTIADP